MSDLNNLIEFVNFINKFREIIRVVDIKGSDSRENDAEHSFQLGVVALYLIDKDSLQLNKQKVLEYALLHDLVEIFAGDTYFLADKSKEDKHASEYKAYKEILSRFPQFKTYEKRFIEYESKKNKEARFVYVLDKILPAINIYLNDGKTLKIENAKFEDVIKNKSEKIKYSDELKEYFEDLLELFKKDKDKLFNG